MIHTITLTVQLGTVKLTGWRHPSNLHQIDQTGSAPRAADQSNLHQMTSISQFHCPKLYETTNYKLPYLDKCAFYTTFSTAVPEPPSTPLLSGVDEILTAELGLAGHCQYLWLHHSPTICVTLASFIVEARRQDGKDYPPNTL